MSRSDEIDALERLAQKYDKAFFRELMDATLLNETLGDQVDALEAQVRSLTEQNRKLDEECDDLGEQVARKDRTLEIFRRALD